MAHLMQKLMQKLKHLPRHHHAKGLLMEVEFAACGWSKDCRQLLTHKRGHIHSDRSIILAREDHWSGSDGS
jgi:hypothetical protein